MTKRKLWAKSFGERRSGVRVRVYESRPGGTLMRSVWNASTGKEDRKSLGHKDKALAERQAYELLAQLVADEEAVEKGTLTLAQLQRLYLESAAFLDKKPKTRKEDARSLERIVAFLGSGREVDTLVDSDVRRYVQARRKGDPKLIGVAPGVSVGDRTIERDLVVLRTMLHWGEAERDSNGRRLLQDNPLRGIAFPKEKNPKRPVATHDDFLSLLDAAGEVHPLLRLGLVIAEGTGRRLSAWRQLRWGDVDLDAGMIRWRAETDKKGYESVVPMPDYVRDALFEARSASLAIGEAWVFPSPKDPVKPCDRHLLDNWLRRAYQLAGMEPKRGSLWHAFRRKWATERKHLPLADVAAAGGWKNSITLQLVYQRTDPETIRTVVHSPNRLRASG